MMRAFVQNLFIKYLVGDGRLVELQNSTLSIVVGVVFIANSLFGGHLYERFPDTYRYMQFVPAYVWGILYAGLGVAHLLSLLIGWKWTRKHVLLVKGSAWIFLGVVVLQADVYAASGYLYLVFAVSAFLAFLSIDVLDGELPNVPNGFAYR